MRNSSCRTVPRLLGEVETNTECDHNRQLGSHLDWASHSRDLPGQFDIRLLSEVRWQPVMQGILDF